MSQHRKQGGKMNSASHPNGSIATPHEPSLCDIKIVSYNEDGSYMAHGWPTVGGLRRYVRRSVFVQEDVENDKV